MPAGSQLLSGSNSIPLLTASSFSRKRFSNGGVSFAVGIDVVDVWSGSQKNGLASRVQTPVQSGTVFQVNGWPPLAFCLRYL